jgi:hypothetical protein
MKTSSAGVLSQVRTQAQERKITSIMGKGFAQP